MSDAVALSADAAAERPTSVRWSIVAIAGLLAVVIYMHRSCIAPAATTIEAEFDIDSTTMGGIQAAFSWGYLFQILGGILSNRWGVRWTLCTFAVGSSLAVFGASRSPSPDALWWAIFGIGLTQAGIIPSVSHMMKDWMPASQRGISGAVFTGSMSIGASLASWLTGVLLLSPENPRGLTWQTIYALYGLIGLAWTVLFLTWFRNLPSRHPYVNRAELELIREGRDDAGAKSPRTTWRVWLAMLGCWNQWCNCGQQFFRNFVYTFFITGFPAFLIKAFGISKEEAGKLNTIPLLTAVFGVFAAGYLIDAILRWTGNRWLSRSGLAAFGHLVCAGCILAAAWMPSAASAATAIGVGIFFFGFGSPCTWAATMDIAGKHTSAFFAVMNTVGVFAGIYCPRLVGRMFDQATAGKISWNQIFYLFAAANVAGALCWICLNSKYPAKLPDEAAA